MEDPIDAIKAGPDDTAGTADDYTNLVAQLLGPFAYSYTFDGMAGYLDHALSSATLTSQVTGVTEWHINSDEADVLDYDMTFKPPAQEALYEPKGVPDLRPRPDHRRAPAERRADRRRERAVHGRRGRLGVPVW